VTKAGGHSPALGTNPLAFGWPRKGKLPYVFDFATSAIARGDLELHCRSGLNLPEGVGIDAQGNPTVDAESVINGGSMLTFGGYKGSALSTMIELIAGPLIGDLTSIDSLEFDADSGSTPCHGELIIAFDPQKFGANDSAENNNARAEKLFSLFIQQGARLPSQRRYEARQRSQENGVFVSKQILAAISQLLK